MIEEHTLPSGIEMSIDRESGSVLFKHGSKIFILSKEDYLRSQGYYTPEVIPKGVNACPPKEHYAETV